VAACRAFLRVVYRETQRWLALWRLPERIPLWRGERRTTGTGLARVVTDLRPIVSCTTSFATARRFAAADAEQQARGLQGAPGGRILLLEVPRQRILATCAQGAGVSVSREVWVLGRAREEAWALSWTSPTDPAAGYTAEDFRRLAEQWGAAPRAG
jgi:hypothetical protein